jgi:hypothetical protein
MLGGVRQMIRRNIDYMRAWANRLLVNKGITLALVMSIIVVLVGARVADYLNATHTLPPNLQAMLDQYNEFPTWMYTDPHNILGLETPSVGEIAPLSLLKKAWRTSNIRFHPDRWQANSFATTEVA